MCGRVVVVGLRLLAFQVYDLIISVLRRYKRERNLMPLSSGRSLVDGRGPLDLLEESASPPRERERDSLSLSKYLLTYFTSLSLSYIITSLSLSLSRLPPPCYSNCSS